MKAVWVLCRILGLLVLLSIAAHVADDLLFPVARYGADTTDSAGGRSGLALRTDFGTGCRYLESRYGGLTPRLMADGRQDCGGHAGAD